jgi:hypothetical protein
MLIYDCANQNKSRKQSIAVKRVEGTEMIKYQLTQLFRVYTHFVTLVHSMNGHAVLIASIISAKYLLILSFTYQYQ